MIDESKTLLFNLAEERIDGSRDHSVPGGSEVQSSTVFAKLGQLLLETSILDVVPNTYHAKGCEDQPVSDFPHQRCSSLRSLIGKK